MASKVRSGTIPGDARRRQSDPQECGSLRDDATTPPDMEALACDAGFRVTADPPPPLTPNATSSIEIQAIKARGVGKCVSSASPISCAVSVYGYSPLPKGCIRLLRLMPHLDKNAPIQCRLFDYPLLDLGGGTHLYEALSYVWGASEKPQFVSTDKGYLPVTTNLHMALKRLRDRSLDRILWVDAICINQDDMEERNRQVQSMATIYAKASCVIVWLEESTAGSGQVHGDATADSDRALEEIRIAADDRSAKSSDSETNQQEILTLLQRSWFRRIWVLQEVAAARRVLIACHSTEIDGYAFCSGLDALNLVSNDPDTQSRIRSAAYLIRGAIFRPKYAANRSDRFSLDIRPLGELIDMYHNREATDRRDKVYALLGMSSNDRIPACLSPDYKVLWKDLFHQLVKSLVSEQVSVETWDEKEIAVINSKGCVLGEISAVERNRMWDDRQNVDIASKNTLENLGQEGKWSARWTLPASAKYIQDGDIVCLLQGASKPTIIRLYEDYCAIIVIAVTPTDEKQTERDIDWLDFLRSKTTFPRDFLLVWDWEKSWGKLEDGGDYECFINSRVPEHAKTELESHLDKAARLRNIGFILGDSEKYEEAYTNLRKVIDAFEKAYGKEDPHTLAAIDNLALIYQKARQWKKAEELYEYATYTKRRVLGLDHPETLDSMANLALTYRGQDNWNGRVKAKKLEVMIDLLLRRKDYAQITEEGLIRIVRSFDEEVIMLLLDRRGSEIQITNRVVEVVASDNKHGKEVMALLLSRRGSEVRITEEAVVEIVISFDKEVMALLLDRMGSEIQITEAVVKAAAGNEFYGEEVMALLLNRRGSDVWITEGVVEAAAGNKQGGDKIMALLLDRKGSEVRITEEAVVQIIKLFDEEVMARLLDRRGSEIQITEAVVKAAAGNEFYGEEVMALLLDRRGSDVWITEGVVEAAAGNNWGGKEIMVLLLDCGRNEVRITEEAIVQIARSFNEEVMKLLPKRGEGPNYGSSQDKARNEWEGK